MKEEDIEKKQKEKKPKYCIGDIIVYPDRYFEKKKDSMLTVHQSKIIEAYAYLETGDPDDDLSWFYHTEHSTKEGEDSLEEEDILYKL